MFDTLGGTFQLAGVDALHRLIIAVDGIDKSGKNYFAFSAPGPIACQSTDVGTEGVIEQFAAEKTIWLSHYRVLVEKHDSPEVTMKKMAPVWGAFVSDFREVVVPALKVGKVRTVVWDTGTEIWDLLRLARFGKLQQVNQYHYSIVNQEFQNLVREVYLDTPGNMVILFKLGDEYRNDPVSGMGNKTGELERKGFKDSAFLVQINATCWRDKRKGDRPKMPTGDFRLTVRNCRQNAGLAGFELTNEYITFPWLAVNVFPGTSLEDWI
jgi:hypothetical protein